MIASYIFPIFDGRPLVDGFPRTEKPSWSPALIGEYVRSFGGMDRKSRGDELAESDYCRGHGALSFGEIPSFDLPLELQGALGQGELSIGGAPNRASRRLYYDGHLTARFEVTLDVPSRKYRGFGERREDKLIVESDIIAPLIRHLCKVVVTVAPGRPQTKTVPLIDAGPTLAQHFALATVSRLRSTSSATRSPDAVALNKLCRAGRPLIILRLQHDAPPARLPRSVIFAEWGDRALDSWTFGGANPAVPVIVLRDRAPNESDIARNMRIFLARYHATAESIALARTRRAVSGDGAALVHLEGSLRILDKLLERLRLRAGDLAIAPSLAAREPARRRLDRLQSLRISIQEEFETMRQLSERGDRDGLKQVERVCHFIQNEIHSLEQYEAEDRSRLRQDDLDKLRVEASSRMVETMRQLWGDPAESLFKQLQQGDQTSGAWPRLRRLLFRKPHDIFISYRRDDSDFARLIYERLSNRFGKDAVFFDRDRLRLGADFPEELTQAVASTRVLVAVIGSNWLGQRAKRVMRIAEPGDWVRREIELALNHQKKIIPVLRNRSGFPKSLPEAIAKLRNFNAIIADSTGEFEHHMTKLVEEIARPF